MVIMAVALIVRYIAAAKYFGNETDMNCFIAWGDMIFKDGIGNFYSSDSFTDYPPGYMYILYMVGAIRHVLGVAWNSTLSVMLTKTRRSLPIWPRLTCCFALPESVGRRRVREF